MVDTFREGHDSYQNGKILHTYLLPLRWDNELRKGELSIDTRSTRADFVISQTARLLTWSGRTNYRSTALGTL